MQQVRLADHLRDAFAPRDVTEASPFRPPPTLMRCVPLHKHSRPPYGGPGPYGAPMTQGAPGGMPPPPLGHRDPAANPAATGGGIPLPKSLHADAEPFMPASLRPASTATPPPASATAPKVEAKVSPLGVRYYTKNEMLALQPPLETKPLPKNMRGLVGAFLTACVTWDAPAYLAEAAGVAASPVSGDERGGLFTGRSAKLRPERQLHHKVMSVLSRVTPLKYDELKVELLALPIRQADDAQLDAVVDVFFKKAIQEEKFSHLYADLVQSIFEVANEEAAAVMSPTTPQSPVSLTTAAYAEKTSVLAKKLRYTLLTRCQSEFEKPYRLTPAETVGEDGSPLSEEQLAELRWGLKKRLCGNIRFVGELYRCRIVTPRVVTQILTQLLKQAHDARTAPSSADGSCDDLLEVFVTLLTTVGQRYEDQCPEDTRRFIETARTESQQEKKHSPRIRFLLMNLVDLADRRWMEVVPGSATTANSKSFSSVRSPLSPATPASATKRKAKGAAATSAKGLPSRTNTASQSFGNLSETPSSPTSGGPSVITSPTKKKGRSAKPEGQQPSASSTPLQNVANEAASPTATPGPAVTCTLAALVAPGPGLDSLDAAQRTRVADARSRAESLFADVPEARDMCEQLATLDVSGTSDVASQRAQIVTGLLDDLFTTRKLTQQRQQLPAVLQLLVECPVVQSSTTASGGDFRVVVSPWFTPAALQKVVCGRVKASIADGVFDDCPTFFANVLEVERASASVTAFNANQSGNWRVLQPGALLKALASGVSEAAVADVIDPESHIGGLAAAVKALKADNQVSRAVKAITDTKNILGLSEDLRSALVACA